MIYIDPESEISLNTSRFLLLIDITAHGAKADTILTLDRLVIYDFLSRNPYILYKLLFRMSKPNNIKITDNEVGGISAKYYDKSEIYSFSRVKSLVLLLFSQRNVEVKRLSQEQAAVTPSIEGKLLCSQLNSIYFKRFIEIAEALRILNSSSPAIVRAQVNALFNG